MGKVHLFGFEQGYSAVERKGIDEENLVLFESCLYCGGGVYI